MSVYAAVRVSYWNAETTTDTMPWLLMLKCATWRWLSTGQSCFYKG